MKTYRPSVTMVQVSKDYAMKKFVGTKPLEIIRTQCRQQGDTIDDYNYRNLGADYIVLGVGMHNVQRPDGTPIIHSGRAYVVFHTFSGRFWGRTDHNVEFQSDSTEHEEEPWFQALLSFFYVEKAHG